MFWKIPKGVQNLILLNLTPWELGKLCILSRQFNERLIGEYFDELWRNLLYQHYFYTGYMRVYGPKRYIKSKSTYIYVGFRRWFERIYIIPNISNTAIIIRRVDWEILKLSENIDGKTTEKSNEYYVKSTISNIHKAEEYYDMAWLTASYNLTKKVIFVVIPGFDSIHFDKSNIRVFIRNYSIENYEIEIIWSHSNVFGMEIRKCSPAEYYFGFLTFDKVFGVIESIKNNDILHALNLMKMTTSVKTDLNLLYDGVAPKSRFTRSIFMTMISSKMLKDALWIECSGVKFNIASKLINDSI